jgi:hypothetical protein
MNGQQNIKFFYILLNTLQFGKEFFTDAHLKVRINYQGGEYEDCGLLVTNAAYFGRQVPKYVMSHSTRLGVFK